MPLAFRSRLGSYDILSALGAGGMGEVYRARDVKLGREVAIKILPEAFSQSQERLARFEREARLLASLNHPNIATIHGLEESGGMRWLVMELVEGETLAERIARGAIPVNDALLLFRQVADGLEAAHEKGIVHRDLKPANMKITPQGKLKVLDFGLAKALLVDSGALDGLSQSPTISREATAPGVILGTAPYMSPEQARGKAADKRADIWAFGCCLYEALCGRRAFAGETASDTIARILEREPDWGRLPKATPAGIQRLLRRCLQKDQGRRLQAIGDARIEIEEGLAVASVVPLRSRRSIAVLPFLSLSADPENEYFADGITEDVIAHLSKIAALRVISRTSVMPFKVREQSLREIAARLSVETVLEGSFRRAGERVRIVAQLIDAESDQHLWAETYDRQLSDIFAIQTDVALHIAAALKAELSPEERTRIDKEPTGDLEAYQLYLKGRHCFCRYTEEGIRKGIQHFEAALEKDPNYALAYVGVAVACVVLGMGYGAGAMKPRDVYHKGKKAATKALELDGDLGEAHSALALLSFVSDFDWKGAERGFKRALALSPGAADIHAGYGLMLSALERYDEAIAAQKKAQELEPLLAVHSSDLASTLLRAGRYAAALQESTRLIDLQPDFPMAHSTLGWAYLKTGRCDEGLVELEKAVSLAPGNTVLLGQLGQAYGIARRVAEARDVLRRLQAHSERRYVPPYHMAYVYVGLGEQDRAIDALELAYEERAGGVYGIKGSFLFDTLRSHSRFVALLRKMNLATDAPAHQTQD